jgi:Growth inhibitor
MDYNNLNNMNQSQKDSLKAIFDGIINNLKHLSFSKVSLIITSLPEICRLHHLSLENKKIKFDVANNPQKFHPIKPKRGEIYNTIITEGIGSELSGNHLAVIMQNKSGNIYAEKVNILPIEGDGSKVNPNYQVKLTNEDLIEGKLNKDPSRIIITDITTIDKARLDIKVGTIKPEKMTEISKKLLAQLELQNLNK